MSAAMMLKYAFGLDEVYDEIDAAVVTVLDGGYRTPDIMQPGAKAVGCEEMGGLIRKEVARA